VSTDTSIRRLRIPVHHVDGVWECSFGGQVPVKNGTRAELLVAQSAIEDRSFLEHMMRKDRHKVLDEGTQLLVALTVKLSSPPCDDIGALAIPQGQYGQQIAIETIKNWSPELFCFVPISIGAPDEKQTRLFNTDSGGLWLVTRGLDAVGLASTTIVLPDKVSQTPVRSLNHAFTKLSEAFETWRISHTGNVYSRVLYQESNGRWYALEFLRAAALDRTEMEIANDLWRRFMQTMSPSRRQPRRR
jgi:hypothetical protein